MLKTITSAYRSVKTHKSEKEVSLIILKTNTSTYRNVITHKSAEEISPIILSAFISVKNRSSKCSTKVEIYITK